MIYLSNNINNSDTVATQQNESSKCPTLVHETVCVQGTVTITPNLTSGPSRSFCIGDPVIGSCYGDLVQTCSFAVSQNICVQIPLSFSAAATAVPNGLVCGTPEVGPCDDGVIGCTYTLGYYKNHPEVTNALIMAAGGSIILGTGSGLSFIVNTANATDVLNFNVPSPPAPNSPPFANQYQVLYAQLLTAKLNVLHLIVMGAEICSYATNAITAADNFLGNSPKKGMPGAPDIQETLTKFNEGNAPGCPPHCD